MYSVFLSRYRNTSESLGEREMLWEHEPQASTCFLFLKYSFLAFFRKNPADKRWDIVRIAVTPSKKGGNFVFVFR